METAEIETLYVKNAKQWRQWLQKNHAKKASVWLIFYRMSTGMPTISWSEAVDQALCFGWIDSVKKPHGPDTSIQFFSKRKARSTWSKINKQKVKRLIEEGLMTEAGLQSIHLAKQNGSWTLLDEVEELIIPKDLEKAFKAWPGSKDFFLSQSKSSRKMLLQWIVLARQTETREKRIHEIAEQAGQKQKPKPFR